jgi:hypothetical protein
VSLIALGNFNPAIVTPDFLTKTCELELGKPTDQSSPFIPVHRSLQFKNLKITLDIDRFQLQEIMDKDIDKTRVLEIFNVFYEKLPYTPIHTVGINVNGGIYFEENDNIKEITKKITSFETYKQFYKVDLINVTEGYQVSNREKKWLHMSVRTDDPSGIVKAFQAKSEKDGATLNFNYEINNLSTSNSKLSLLSNSYSQFHLDFQNFTSQLEA